MPLEKIIRAYTRNSEIIKHYKSRIHPLAISRLGGTLKPYVGDDLPEEWPNPKFVPESLPVVFFYEFDAKKISQVVNKFDNQGIPIITGWPIEALKPVGSLGDVRRWIEDSRNQERFFVSILLICTLSIFVFLSARSLYGRGQSVP